MSRIAAIPTVYNGIKMRSKLEASFAKALDSYRLEWVYEAEGFDVDGVWYLPDFYLPSLRAFIEVKGILDESVAKPRALAARLKDRKVFLADPSSVQSWSNGSPRLVQLGEHAFLDKSAALAKCSVCGLHGLYTAKHCPRIYLAGKVYGKRDWRLDIVPDLRTAFREQTQWPQLLIRKAVAGRHVYMGPFFRTDSTRTLRESWDGSDLDSHMMDTSMLKGHDPADYAREDVFSECLSAIDNCDVVFAWIDDCDCFGTLFELGYARKAGKPVYWASNLGHSSLDDMWFARCGGSGGLSSRWQRLQ